MRRCKSRACMSREWAGVCNPLVTYSSSCSPRCNTYTEEPELYNVLRVYAEQIAIGNSASELIRPFVSALFARHRILIDAKYDMNMEVKSNFNTVQPHWAEDGDDTCVSSISNVSDPNKEQWKRERRASKACNTNSADGGVPKYVCDGDARKEPSKVLGEIIREIHQGSSSPPPKEIDLIPPTPVDGTTAEREEHPSTQSPDRSPPRSGSNSHHHHRPSSSTDVHEKIPSRQGQRRASVETPRIQSRRASIGGTTIYPTSHMAKIDTFLRGAELRLNKNGTCSFLFEEKKFVIETTAETNEFMFHCSLGTLAQWKKVWSKKLLRMMALWNEVQLITKFPKEDSKDASKNSEDEEDQDDVGLLRIDSSKENGSLVAFILYGHVDKIKDSIHFQDKLDEFVDNALKFYDKLKVGPEENEDKEKEPKRPQPPCFNTSLKTSSTKTSLTCSLTSSEPEGGTVASSTHFNHHESSPEEATPALSNNSSHGHDDCLSSKKSGVFTKMIKSLRSKSKQDIGGLAFIDPNQNSAFVVDTSTVDDLKIKISRQNSKRGTVTLDDDNNHQPRSRRGGAFTDEIQSSSHSRRGSAIDDEHRVHPKKGASLHVVEDRPRMEKILSQKSSSFFHVEEKRASSFHKPRNSGRRISAPDALNASIEDFNHNLSDRDRCRSSRFNQSEPVIAQNRDETASPPKDKEYRRHQTSEHHRKRRSSSRPRRKGRRNDPPRQGMGRHSVHPDPSVRGGKEKEKNSSRSGSSRRKSQAPAPPKAPSRPTEMGRSRSISALRSKVERSRSRSALRTNGIDQLS